MKGYIYLLENNINGEKKYKIGFSKNVEKRVKQLSTANPGELEIIKKFKSKWGRLTESMIHSQFEMKRIKGEWFDLDKNDINSIDDVFDKVEKNINILKDNYYYKKRYKL